MPRKQMNKEESKIEPMMLSQCWQSKWTKNKLRENLEWCLNDKKQNEHTIMRNKGTKKKFRLNLGSCPNDEKPLEEMIKHR